MRALVWITENSWEDCIDRARELLPDASEVTLLHVASSEVEELAAGGASRLLGRRPPPPPGPPVPVIAAEEAQALLESARERLGRPAETIARRGRVEREVIDACGDADLLMLVRDGELRAGPRSLGPKTRFVVDHAPCEVLLVWPGQPPPIDPERLPPHLR